MIVDCQYRRTSSGHRLGCVWAGQPHPVFEPSTAGEGAGVELDWADPGSPGYRIWKDRGHFVPSAHSRSHANQEGLVSLLHRDQQRDHQYRPIDLDSAAMFAFTQALEP